MPKLMYEFDASFVRLYPDLFDSLVNQVGLAVPETTHSFGLWRIIRASLREFDTARGEKVANAIEPRFSIYISSVVRCDVEGTKCFPFFRGTLLKELVEHLFPTYCMKVGCIGDHAI